MSKKNHKVKKVPIVSDRFNLKTQLNCKKPEIKRNQFCPIIIKFPNTIII